MLDKLLSGSWRKGQSGLYSLALSVIVEYVLSVQIDHSLQPSSLSKPSNTIQTDLQDMGFLWAVVLRKIWQLPLLYFYSSHCVYVPWLHKAWPAVCSEVTTDACPDNLHTVCVFFRLCRHHTVCVHMHLHCWWVDSRWCSGTARRWPAEIQHLFIHCAYLYIYLCISHLYSVLLWQLYLSSVSFHHWLLHVFHTLIDSLISSILCSFFCWFFHSFLPPSIPFIHLLTQLALVITLMTAKEIREKRKSFNHSVSSELMSGEFNAGAIHSRLGNKILLLGNLI